jgi:hypothetical protein
MDRFRSCYGAASSLRLPLPGQGMLAADLCGHSTVVTRRRIAGGRSSCTETSLTEAVTVVSTLPLRCQTCKRDSENSKELQVEGQQLPRPGPDRTTRTRTRGANTPLIRVVSGLARLALKPPLTHTRLRVRAEATGSPQVRASSGRDWL